MNNKEEVPVGMPKHHVEWMLDNMREESLKLQRKINHTPRWRVIKRYFLLEKLYKLDESRGLIAHVMNDDEGY
jgi:hypothetical protein